MLTVITDMENNTKSSKTEIINFYKPVNVNYDPVL